MSDVESKILAKALGRLGGFVARWVAGRLPSIAHESRVELEVPFDIAVQKIAAFVASHGRSVPELVSEPGQGSFFTIVGSGHLNLNPTILQAQVAHAGEYCSVRIRAVAKEGAIPQDSAKKLVARLAEALEE